jgi:methylated-DNA-protein-cysteine methyltransferase related protein
MSDFFHRVYAVVRNIPEGKVCSYGAIARFLGSGKSARVVGYAMNASHLLDVPAHRVVNRNGLLTGKHHFDGNTLMQDLLAEEGIEVSDNQIIDLQKHFWDPSDFLNPSDFEFVTPYIPQDRKT